MPFSIDIKRYHPPLAFPESIDTELNGKNMPWKINPKNPFPLGDFWMPCQVSGVFPKRGFTVLPCVSRSKLIQQCPMEPRHLGWNVNVGTVLSIVHIWFSEVCITWLRQEFCQASEYLIFFGPWPSWGGFPCPPLNIPISYGCFRK